MVGLGRIELPTYGLGNRRSVQLSYSPNDTSRVFAYYTKKIRKIVVKFWYN